MAYLKLAKRFTLSDFAYAHRGLWTSEGPVENSLRACLDAAENGLGIEFDVRPDCNGKPMVFHDKTLDRLTRHTGKFENLPARALEQIHLADGSKIVSLETLLDAWPGQTPLLCEIKIDGKTDPFSFASEVGRILSDHKGPAAAMSFSFEAVIALPKGLMRGQLIDKSSKIGEESFAPRLNAITTSHADYIACHTNDADRVAAQGQALGLPTIVWTTRDAETCVRLKSIVSAQIFEGFDPELAKPAAAPKL